MRMRRTSSRFSSTARLSTAARANSTVARCQRSWLSASTTETFLRRSRSLSERSVWRLSLRLELKGSSSSSLTAQNKQATLRLPRDLYDLEELQNIALFDVVEVLDADAALEALAHRADVVLEASQGSDVALVDHDAVPLGHLLGGVGRPDVEAQHDPTARRTEHDVRVGHRPDTRAHDVDPHL